MKKNELVWRELVDAAIMRGQRRWNNIDDLAFYAGVAPATAAYALRRLVEIGAIQQYPAGFAVINPEKVLTVLCAARSVVTDAKAIVTLNAKDTQSILVSATHQGAILGGPTAAIELLGGENTVSDYSEHVLYFRDGEAEKTITKEITKLEVTHHTGLGRDRGNLTLLIADQRAARTWQKHTSFAQTYADLFATPGWQASEFRFALHEKFLKKRDWDQE